MSDTVHIRDLAEMVLEDYYHVDAIRVGHYPRGSEAVNLQIHIYSPCSEDISNYSSDSYVSVEKKRGVSEYPYEVYQTTDAPKYVTGMSSTSLYVDEDAYVDKDEQDAGAVELDVGLSRLGRKLDGVCTKCGSKIHDPHRHYAGCGKTKRW